MMERLRQSDLLYYDDPVLGRTLRITGALVPWLLCMVVLGPILMLLGLSATIAYLIVPWIGFILSVIAIDRHFA